MDRISYTSTAKTLSLLIGGLASAVASAGTFTIDDSTSRFSSNSSYDSLVDTYVLQVPKTSAAPPYLGLRADASQPATSFQDCYEVVAEWNPSYSGEPVPSGCPVLSTYVEVQSYGASGSAISVISGGSSIYSALGIKGQWSLLSTASFSAYSWMTDPFTGTWTARFQVVRYMLSASGSSGAYGSVGLRYTPTGISMQ